MPVVRKPVSTETAVQSEVFGGWTQSFARTRWRSWAHRKMVPAPTAEVKPEPTSQSGLVAQFENGSRGHAARAG